MLVFIHLFIQCIGGDVYETSNFFIVGKCGISLTFVTQFDISRLKNIEEYIGEYSETD